MKDNSKTSQALYQYLESLAWSGITDLKSLASLEQDGTLDRVVKSLAATREFTVRTVAGPSQSPPRSSNPPVDAVNTPRSPETRRPGMIDSESPVASESTVTSESKIERLQVLQSSVASCTRCPELVENRTQTVFGVGDPEARLCFVGEAPGADEDRKGEPFVGAAGQLLNRIITACEMDRGDVYIMNTLKCRPPNNRNPTDDECLNCRDFFDSQLEIIRPEFICCLGGIAAHQLLNTKMGIGRLRGQIHDYRGIKVVVTYHPAYLLRNPDAKRLVWADMKFLMKEMGHQLSGR